MQSLLEVCMRWFDMEDNTFYLVFLDTLAYFSIKWHLCFKPNEQPNVVAYSHLDTQDLFGESKWRNSRQVAL